MTDSNNFVKYDELLTNILVNEKSILGFLSTIFNFLARRTDFYYVPEGPYENMGFPPGVAEELVVKVLRTWDPKNWKAPNGAKKPTDVNNEIMCSMVAQEVEISTDDNEEIEPPSESNPENIETNTDTESVTQRQRNYFGGGDSQPQNSKDGNSSAPSSSTSNEAPPIIPTQKNSDTYNGAERDKYLWSQTITELDITVKMPPDIKSSKDLKVTINPGDICVMHRSGDMIMIKGSLPFKIKTMDSFWSISEKKLLIHLEKVQDRWWNRLLDGEEPIDLSKIDCSRSLYDLPEDHIAKVREMQWNQEQKMKGLPTMDHLRNMEILKKAWNADGSPFKGQEFDPNVLHNQ